MRAWLKRLFYAKWRLYLRWAWRWFFMLVICGVAGWVGGQLAAKPPDTFDWTVGAITATAAGTIILALATWALAYDTRRDVEATLNDQRSRDRPTVIVASLQIVEAATGQDGIKVRVSVSLFNMGLGPAIGIEAKLAYLDPEPETLTFVSTKPSPAKLAFIQTGHDGTIEFDALVRGPRVGGVVTGPTEPLDPKRFIVLGDYYDRRGQAGERYDNGIIDGYRSDNMPPDEPPEPLVAFG